MEHTYMEMEYRGAYSQCARTRRKELIMDMATRLYAERKVRALAHWRRTARLVGRLRGALLQWLNEVQYRPGNSGSERAREEFEAAAAAAQSSKNDLVVDDARSVHVLLA